jgi:hypothetical protein
MALDEGLLRTKMPSVKSMLDQRSLSACNRVVLYGSSLSDLEQSD